jgi:NAD(P)-dependent dehydrogenase (short-subunit alcohol dehydrogenase family)
MRGRVALVTGAASGMGQLSAWRLAADDVVVAALDVDEDGLARTARRAPQVHPFVVDVRDADRIDAVVGAVEDELGSIARVVNAAAVAPTRKLAEQPAADMRLAMEVNYCGLVNVTTSVLPRLLERRQGDLVQFGSLAGWLPSQCFGAYSASKAAVVSFTETLYHELRNSGLRIVCVCPPVVDTPLLDQVGQHGPKGFDSQPRIQPEEVLDSIERALDHGELWAFPGRGTTTLWRLRRLLPGLLWKRIDALEAGAQS